MEGWAVGRTISERISEAAALSFVGRRAELEALGGAVRGDKPGHLVVFLHGPGGIGKSRLLQAALGSVPPDVRTLLLDCREIEPTPWGFLRAAGTALGMEGADLDAADVAQLIGGAAARAVLALDTYETFGLLDTWLRQVFIPTLPEHVLTIISGREPPGAAWLSAPGWAGLVGSIELRALGHADAVQMLRSRGLSELQAARANSFARGHPLALGLAAAALSADADLRIELGQPPKVLEQLLETFLARLPAETLEVVEAASTVRRVNEPVLRALLDVGSARDAFEQLRRLPFVDRTTEGLLVHDVVRDAVAQELAQRDPEAHARYRRRAARFLAAETRRAAANRLWEATADLLFLIKHPSVKNAFFPSGSLRHAVEPATSADGADIARIARENEGAEAAGWVVRWWERHPEGFIVARSGAGRPEAFLHHAELGDVDEVLLAADPVGACWCAHLGEHPPRGWEVILIMRRWLSREGGELPTPANAACWVDLTRTFMELRPRLGRLYSVMADLPGLAPIAVPLGFAPLEPVVELDGVSHYPVLLDFGERSVDGWLARMIDEELEDDDSRAPVAGWGRVAPPDELSARELEVLLLLAEGASNRAIGERLTISDRTVGRHVANIFAKLGVHTRAEAARIAAERGLTGSSRPS
jgi:DNA-binding CsgD family transcriptional regulator